MNNLNYAIKKIKSGDLDTARLTLERLLKLEPTNAKIRTLLAKTLIAQKQYNDAEKQLAAALKSTSDLTIIDYIANLSTKLRLNLGPVLSAYKSFLTQFPLNSTALYNYGYYTSKNNEPEKAIERYNQALKKCAKAPEEIHLNIAKIYSEALVDIDNAEKHLNISLELRDHFEPALFNLANLKEQAGERTESEILFNKCLKINSQNTLALSRLIDLNTNPTKKNILIGKSRQILKKNKNIDLLYSTARALESMKAHSEAWTYYNEANRLNRKLSQAYHHDKAEELLNRLIQTYDTQWIAKSKCNNQHQPIFITGMFRSGTTLLEQMLACHSEIAPSGERPCIPQFVNSNFKSLEDLKEVTDLKLDALSSYYTKKSKINFGKIDFLIDKRPDNLLNIGLIYKAFPNAKIIFIKRNWRDIAISIYSHRFGQSQNYSNSIKDIKHHYFLQERLAEHWKALIPNSIIEIEYEALIQDPEITIVKALKFLNLPWEESILEFHKRRCVVQTPSVWQVRTPIYATSIGRWRPFNSLTDDFL